MAWERVDAGTIGDEAYVTERRVFRMPVPMTVSRLPVQLRSYRWKLISPDGTASVEGSAKTRASIDGLVMSYRTYRTRATADPSDG